MHRISAFIGLICLVSCVGAGKFQKLQSDKSAAELSFAESKSHLEAANERLSVRLEDATAEMVKQNILLSQLLNDKVELEKEVAILKDRIVSMGSESKTLENELNAELQRKNENLRAKETKLNSVINWMIQQESFLLNISSHLGEVLSDYSEDQVDWLMEEDQLVIILGQSALFQSQNNLAAHGQTLLEKIGALLRDYPSTTITLEGHTDNSQPDHRIALEQTALKAVKVAAFLIDLGVNNNQIIATARGGSMPRVSNQTPSGRLINNRIEIWIKPPYSQMLKLLEE